MALLQCFTSGRIDASPMLEYGYTSEGVSMRTNIVLDEKLVQEAMKLANVKTMREAVNVALQRFVQSGRQKRLLELHGAGGVRRNYNYKKTRSGD